MSGHKPEFKIGVGRPAYDGRHPSFSFKWFDDGHKDYSCSAMVHLNEWELLLRHLKGMSALTWGQIKQAHQYHAHEIVWSKTSEPTGFKKLPQYVQQFPPFQFKAFKEFRVIGFFNPDSVFEVVWFDRKHDVYPSPRR